MFNLNFITFIIIRKMNYAIGTPIEITNWHQPSCFEKYGLLLIGGLIGFLSAFLMDYLRRRNERKNKQITAYYLLVALVDEMKRNLDRSWAYIKQRSNNDPASESILSEDAKKSCLLDFVKSTETHTILTPLFSFLENVNLINTHQILALQSAPKPASINDGFGPIDDKAHYILAQNFAMNKHVAMCQQFNKVLSYLNSLANQLDKKIPDDFLIIPEGEITTREQVIQNITNPKK